GPVSRKTSLHYMTLAARPGAGGRSARLALAGEGGGLVRERGGGPGGGPGGGGGVGADVLPVRPVRQGRGGGGAGQPGGPGGGVWPVSTGMTRVPSARAACISCRVQCGFWSGVAADATVASQWGPMTATSARLRRSAVWIAVSQSAPGGIDRPARKILSGPK